MSTSSSELQVHRDEILALVEDGVSYTTVANLITDRGTPTTRHSVRRFVSKMQEQGATDGRPAPDEAPGMRQTDDQTELTSPKRARPITVEELCEHFNVNLDDEEIVSKTINAWGYNDEREPLYQTKVVLKRKKPLNVLLPARPDAPYIAPQRVVDRRKVKTVLMYGDQQCPFIDWDLFDGILKLTREFRPDLIIDPGDGRDFPSVSRHKTYPKWKAAAQECLDSKYLADREMRRANEDARIVQFLGNHDIRLADYEMNQSPEAYGLTPACAPDEERQLAAHSIQNLGRLDELGIELVTDELEAYDQARFMLTDRLGVEHGNKTGKDPALKAQSRKTFGIVMGHTHGQSINHTTVYDHLGQSHVHVAVETGTGALIDRGLGYAPNPNWVAGAAWATIHEDGGYHIDLITKRDGFVQFRDRRY